MDDRFPEQCAIDLRALRGEPSRFTVAAKAERMARTRVVCLKG